MKQSDAAQVFVHTQTRMIREKTDENWTVRKDTVDIFVKFALNSKKPGPEGSFKLNLVKSGWSL